MQCPEKQHLCKSLNERDIMPIRVAIFDDSRDRRESLRYLIGMYDDLLCVGTFEDAIRAVDNVKSCLPDVILMDIEMPKVNGVEAVRAIKKVFPKMVILMQTVFEDDEYLFNSIKEGASGYLLKRDEPSQTIAAIREADQGGAPINPAMAMRVLRYFQQEPVSRQANDYALTEKEHLILSLLVDGLSYKMIADKEDISFHTVNTHIRRIYEKLHVHSMSEAVGKALREKLV